MSYYFGGGNQAASFAIRYYETASGQCPFEDWFDSLDKNDRIMIDSRLKRIRRGLWGDSKYLGGGIYELRFHVGAGHRISYGRDGETVVILLEAGVKKGQSADIDRARRFWQEYAGRARK